VSGIVTLEGCYRSWPLSLSACDSMPGCVIASNCVERPSDVQQLENVHTNTRKDLMHNEGIWSTEWDMTCPAFFKLRGCTVLLAHTSQ
jgi:hypothetical protein